MGEIIDRVARELCDFDLGKDAWDYTGEHECRDDYRALARIAIKAMREPTYGMRHADAVNEWPEDATACWKAMIDAALSDASSDTPETRDKRDQYVSYRKQNPA